MKILCVGDIVGRAGRDAVEDLLAELRRIHQLDFVIANAENSAGGRGITSRTANQLFASGCDVLTLGDHVWDKREIDNYLEITPRIIRPANFPNGAPGRGWVIAETRTGHKIGILNLLGRTFMRYNVECPFRMAQALVEQIKKETPIIVVDMHAETTSEKIAMGYFLDGKVSAVVGTHTHIQTADEKVLRGGTAYITDLGMTGPYDSVIGQNKEKIIERFLTSLPVRFEVATDDVYLHGVIIEIDEASGRAKSIRRIQQFLDFNGSEDNQAQEAVKEDHYH